MSGMGRREFVALVGGAAATWPLLAQAQQSERMRRIGVLMTLAADDPEGQARLTAFVQGLQELGWTDGRNVQIDYRWPAGDAERIRRYAAELAALAPDIILAGGGAVVPSLLQATRTIPIVFTQTPDPVGAGFVESLARPGGNVTGFTAFEYGIGAKWLELLKEIAPHVTRAAVIRDTAVASGIGQWGAIQTAAPSFGVDCAQSTCAMPARSSAPWRPSRAPQMEASSWRQARWRSFIASRSSHLRLATNCPRSTHPAFSSPAAV